MANLIAQGICLTLTGTILASAIPAPAHAMRCTITYGYVADFDPAREEQDHIEQGSATATPALMSTYAFDTRSGGVPIGSLGDVLKRYAE